MSIFADDFLDLMTSSITVAPLTKRADDGVPTYGAPQTFAAHISYKQHNVLGAHNQMIVARGTAWIDTGVAIGVNSRITLPDGSNPIILVSNLMTDETGPAYVRLDFQ